MLNIRSRQRGFSLIELAIGLVIVSALLSALLVPLATQMTQRRTADTQKLLDEAREALIGFAIANGRLPCPAEGNATGVEVFAAGNDASTGNCKTKIAGVEVATGFLPGITLGMSPLDAQGYVVDAFGTTANRLRYSVATASTNGQTFPLTKLIGMRNATMTSIGTSTAYLVVCAAASNTPNAAQTDCPSGMTKLANGNALAVIHSVGPNGADTVRTPSDDEKENADGVDLVFVSHDRSDLAGAEYDDMVTWISPSILFSRLVAAGTLP